MQAALSCAGKRITLQHMFAAASLQHVFTDTGLSVIVNA